MEFKTGTSPYLPVSNDLSRLMLKVILGLIPGALCLFLFFGWGVITNLLIATATAVASEAAMLRLRGKPIAGAAAAGALVDTLHRLRICHCRRQATLWWTWL